LLNNIEEFKMPVNQISKIQVRSGLQSNLPLLDKGELGWAVDTQQLYIGNGTPADGAPFTGNTEILTGSGTVSGATAHQGTFNESVNGTRVTFTFPGGLIPANNSLIVWNNFPLIPGGIGYTYPGLAGSSSVTFSKAPEITDNIYFFCLT
jgi:hypothetical protein